MTARACKKSKRNNSSAAKAISTAAIGRFAPSPTGRLHAGSLLAALGSYVHAKHHAGQWLVRIEDLDPPRTEPGASDNILQTLTQHGLHADGPVLFQSQRGEIYEAALEKLLSRDLIYPCRCSRTQLLEHANRHQYPTSRSLCTGQCHVQGATLSSPDTAWRLRTQHAGSIRFHDELRGPVESRLHDDVGDIVLKRRDGLYAYQLAVVVDDAACQITEVVRGADLLDNTARQCWLMHCLELTRPSYLHLPLVTAANGQKLSKQNHAPALNPKTPSANLWHALVALGQRPEPALLKASPEEILLWACANWQPKRIPLTDSLT